ncbi:MAG: FAD-binding protein, partial [Planctomycetota bacterium]
MLEQHFAADRTTVAGSIAAAQSLLSSAHEDGHSILPCGRGSRLKRNLPEARPQKWLSLAGMQELLWLDTEDQTCAVQAGMLVADLQEQLKVHGLMLECQTPG